MGITVTITKPGYHKEVVSVFKDEDHMSQAVLGLKNVLVTKELINSEQVNKFIDFVYDDYTTENLNCTVIELTNGDELMLTGGNTSDDFTVTKFSALSVLNTLEVK